MGLNKTPIMDEDDIVRQVREYDELVTALEDYVDFLTEEVIDNFPERLEDNKSHRYVIGRNLRNKIDERKNRVEKNK